jgi:GDPmannose 4,6-dehydratase
MKTAIITGVTGQDGGYLAEQLLDDGYRVIGVARRTSQPNVQNLNTVLNRKHFFLVEGDVTDAGNIHRLVQNSAPEQVYNLAAQSHVGVSFNEPSHTWDVVARGTLNVLEAVRCCAPECRVYQASSSEMFGSNYSMFDKDGKRYNFSWHNLGYNPPTSTIFQDELTPFCPNSPYATAKLAAHNLARVYRESYGMFVVGGILLNHESEKRGEQFVTRKITRWVGRVVAAKQKGLPAPRLSLGNPNAIRDWGYAPEYMQAARLMLNADKPQDFVIATGYGRSVREFLKQALNSANLLACTEQELVKWEVESHTRPCEVGFLRGNPKEALRVLGWEAKTTFEPLVDLMVAHDIELALKESR